MKLERYYLDTKTNNWIKDEGFHKDNAKSDGEGNYQFEDLDSYVYKEGQYYLAGYKVLMAKEPDRAEYAITLYRQETEGRNSDLRKDLSLNEDEEYIIIADKVKEPKNTPYIVGYQGEQYDLVTTRDQKDYDAGYIAYPRSKITGNIFEDIEYDGMLDGEDGYSEDLKKAIGENRVKITAKAYYYDEGWKACENEDGEEVTYSTEETSDGDGYYEIEVPTQFQVEGESRLAGYMLEVSILPEGYHMTKYLKNKGDGDSSLVKREKTYRLTKTESKKGYQGALEEELEGKVVAARPADKETLKANVNVQNGYDRAQGRTLKDYNVGYTKIQSSAIEGISFEDINYNGIYEEDKDEIIAGAKVGIKRYYYKDGEWILDNGEKETENPGDTEETPDPENPGGVEVNPEEPSGSEADGEGYYMTLTTDENGYYKFDHLPTYREEGEENYLYGYTVWYLGGVENLAVTKYQMNKGIDDSALDVQNDQIIKKDGTIAEMKEGYTIIAHKADDAEDEGLPYIVEGYDIAEGRTRSHYNLGFTNYQEGVIEGKAFIEEDYNGICDEHDKGVADIEVGIKRYIYNPNTKEWRLSQEEEEGYFATVKTDEEGNYSFRDLETYRNISGVKYLYGYKVWLIQGMEETPVTKYQTNKGINDNALVADTNEVIKKDRTLPEMKDGYIIVADKPEKAEEVDPFYMIEGYDLIAARHRDNYNIGYVPYQMGSIEGIAFDDPDYDGIYTDRDRILRGVEIGLKSYYYDEQEKKWKDAGAMAIEGESEGPQYIAITETDDNGYYIFDNLPSLIQIDETRKCLMGYELWMISEDGDRFITKYQMNNGEKDSALIAKTHQIIKKDKTLPEMKDGKIIIGDSIKGQENINTRYVIEGYDTVKGTHRIEYNMGFVSKERYHISGNIWEDKDADGINKDERKMEGIKVTLERYYLINGGWKAMEGSTTVETDAQGNYIFDNLEIYGIQEEQEVLYGYKVKVEEIPKGYDITEYQTNQHENDSDMRIETGYLEEEGEMIVLADKADETTSELYNFGGYNISHGHDQDKLDGGLVPYGEGILQGVVFEDANRNGILDEGEKVIKGATVYLDYQTEAKEGEAIKVNSNEVYEQGRYESFRNKKAKTDKDGVFRFENLPIVDEENQVYRYRLRMNKPNGTEYTKVYPLKAKDEKKNIYGGRVTEESSDYKNEGITSDILLASSKGKENYYNLEWNAKGKEYTNLYLGYYQDTVKVTMKKVLNEKYPKTDGNKYPKTNDSSQPELFLTMMVMSGLYITYYMLAYRRRRKETE